MMLPRVYKQWLGISLLGDHFCEVLRGRKLYVIILVYLVAVFVGLCLRVLVCGRKLLFLVLFRNCHCLSWGYWCPCWGHWPGCGYTAGRRCFPIVPLSWLFLGTLWPDRIPWKNLTKWSGFPPLCVRIPVSLRQRKVCLTSVTWLSCERWFFWKIYPDRVHWCVTCSFWLQVQSYDDVHPDVHWEEGCGHLPLCHYDVFNPVFLCAECRGYFIVHMEGPTVVGKFAAFSVKRIPPYWRMCVRLFSSLRVIEYSHDLMLKKNVSAISWLIAVFRCIFFGCRCGGLDLLV